MEYLYRYERAYAGELEPAKIRLVKFNILRTTPKGVWIDLGYEKWVSNDSKKRYAYPTKDEAFVNFIARTIRCVKILKAKLMVAEDYLKCHKNGTLIMYESRY
jgi:hypothetical protein